MNALDDPGRTVIPKRKVALRYLAPTPQEVAGAEWLGSNRDNKQKIYATYSDIRVPALVAYGLIPKETTTPILESSINTINSGYIYLGYVNNIFRYGATNPSFIPGNKTERELQVWDIALLSKILDGSFKIYDNRVSTIYWLPKQ